MISKIEFLDLNCVQVATLEKLIDGDEVLKKNVTMMICESWDMKHISGAIIISYKGGMTETNYHCWFKIMDTFKVFQIG